MHRFFAFHPFTIFHPTEIAAAALLLASKSEGQPRQVEEVVKALWMSIEKTDIDHESLPEFSRHLCFNETFLLQTLGFDTNIEHP